MVRTPRLTEPPPGNSTQGATPPRLTPTRQKATEMTPSPSIFWRGVSPRERPCATLSMSSRSPMAAAARVARTAMTRSMVQEACRAQVSTVPTRMTAPPIVGVPCFCRWRCGPSALTCWPTPS